MMTFEHMLTIFCLLHNQQHLRADNDVVIYNEFPWKKVEIALTTLCPPLEICGRRLNGSFDPLLACCTACACNEDCHTTGTCYLVDKGLQEYNQCVYPRTKHHNSTFDWGEIIQPYMIINKPPLNGCDTKHSLGCNSDDFTRLSPVSDDNTGRVYFDVDCALCHGISETRPWNPIFNCLHVIRVDRIDVAYEVQKYFDDPSKSQCFFTFMPDAVFKVRSSACHISISTEWVFDSSEKLELADSLNMTIAEIKELCYSNINMPYKSVDSNRWFINPFCYFHDGGRVADGCKLDDRILNPYNYGVLMDYEKVKQLQTMDRTKQAYFEQVCYPLEISGDLNQESRCRQAHCPTGRLFSQSGKCELITSNMLSQRSSKIPLSVNIKLSPIDDGEYTEEDFQNITVDEVRKALPWQETWMVMFVGYIPRYTFNQTVLERSGLVVRIVLLNGNLDFCLERIPTYMENPVFLNISGQVIRFIQSFYHQIVKRFKDFIKGSNLSLPDHVQSLFQPWIPFTILSDRIEGIVISKLYFCKQVELQLAEFKLYITDLVLYNKISGTYFYELEFKVLRDNIGFVTRARLCVEDAGFVLSTRGCSSTKSFNALFLFVLLTSSKCIDSFDF